MDILALMPSTTPSYMAPAWLSCLRWSLGEPDVVEAFREQTGCQWTPGRTPLQHMIDQATGADVAFLRQYIEWFNDIIWGEV